MSTHGHIIYQNEKDQFLMRWHMNDSYILTHYLYPGLGKTLIEKFNNEENIKQLFELKKHFLSIVNTEDDYKKSVADNIKEHGVKKHEQQEKLFFDKVAFINGQAIKKKKVSKDDNYEYFTNLKDCLKECEEHYVYLYKQSDKNWHIKVGNQFISLKNALHIKTKYEKITMLNAEIGIDQNKTPLLEFKISKRCFQLLCLVSNYDLHEAGNVCNHEKFLGNQTRSTFEINTIKDYSKKYELYRLNKKLNKIVENKPNEVKKLKI